VSLIADPRTHSELSLIVEQSGRCALLDGEQLFCADGSSDSPDIVVLGASSRETADSALQAASRLRAELKTVPVVLVTAYSSEEVAIRALRCGVTDIIRLPVAPDELRNALLSVARDQNEAESARNSGSTVSSIPSDIIGCSSSMRRVRDFASRVATTETTVLITGETGTGKELVARLIHRLSRRSSRPLITVNCAAIPESLLEGELFGYERGAFTGATVAHSGKLGAANGGTLFLDEIGDLSLLAQAKILRLLESGEIYRLGSYRPTSVNIRFIAATNTELEHAVAAGGFRRDLFYRLNIARLTLPSLRQRKEDIPDICAFYLTHFHKIFGKQTGKVISPDLMAALQDHDWPGNVRELRNVLEILYLNSNSELLTRDDLPETCIPDQQPRLRRMVTERERLIDTLRATNWNKSRAAERLRWSRMTLYRKLAKYQIVSIDSPAA
jgi:DNA-binding NtrC family response regulator